MRSIRRRRHRVLLALACGACCQLAGCFANGFGNLELLLGLNSAGNLLALPYAAVFPLIEFFARLV